MKELRSPLPNNWVWLTLGEIADIKGGLAKGQKRKSGHEMQTVPYLRVANVQRGFLDLRDIRFIDATVAEIRELCLQPNDILFNEGGDRDKLGRGWIWQGEIDNCIHQNHVFRARLKSDKIQSRLISWYANSVGQAYFLAGGKQTTNLASLNLSTLRALPIPLPPLNEQKRIADKLDVLLARVDAFRERLERVPQILKRFRQSVLAAAVSGKLTEDWRRAQLGLGSELEQLKSFEFDDASCFGPLTFPSSWEVGRLSDISEILGGMTKDTKKQNSADLEVPYLRVANVQRGFLDLTEMKSIRIPQRKLELLTLEPGDILFTEGGDLDKLGRGWVWSGEIEKCSFQNHIFRARLHNKGYQPKFFSWYSNSYGFYYFLAYGKQTTNLASVNKSLVQALPVVIPSSAEQAEIVKRIDFLFKAASAVDNHLNVLLSQSNKLTPALLAKAFAGELVPQDPNDEPAAEMLARLSKTTNASVPQEKPKRKKTLTASVSKRG